MVNSLHFLELFEHTLCLNKSVLKFDGLTTFFVKFGLQISYTLAVAFEPIALRLLQFSRRIKLSDFHIPSRVQLFHIFFILGVRVFEFFGESGVLLHF